MQRPFERAVEQHGATVLRVCRAVLGSDAEADDAWSETFLAALRAWPDLDEGTNVEAWLVRVAHRKAIDIIRARSRRAIPTEVLPESATGDEPADAIAALDLWHAVRRLPERQRLAVAYHHLGGLPHAETAAIIGGTAAAVRRAASDGLKSLRRSHDIDSTSEGSLG